MRKTKSKRGARPLIPQAQLRAMAKELRRQGHKIRFIASVLQQNPLTIIKWLGEKPNLPRETRYDA